MKMFFLLYWGTLGLTWLAWRSYATYYRQHVLRHQYAQQHRARLRRQFHREHGHSQLHLFSEGP